MPTIENIKYTTNTINSALHIGIMLSNKDVIINFNWTLWDMNRNGRKVLNNLKTFKNCKLECELYPLEKYFSKRFWKSNIEQQTIIKSILFQLSLK